ncbi:MAG: leucyl aminopeptidase [Gammaproteobacteria bacterium]|nr:leucyl aminopeptidase [Gammaproteobacteria bacterium]MBU1655079.1 leucyl aminopeptidase [Gammaproteobacteria bacterium]MBU1961551.1 leucyl aminopeptidase [Gammaproteobacteria bacterium]
MDYELKSTALEKLRTDCLVIGVYAGHRLSEAAAAIDRSTQGQVLNALKKIELDKCGALHLLLDAPHTKAERILLVGLGPRKEYGPQAYRKAVSAVVGFLRNDRSTNLTLTLAAEPCKKASPYELSRDAVLAAEEALYRFDACKSDKAKDAPKHPLTRLQFWQPNRKAEAKAQKGLAHGRAIAQALALAKDLANLPGNICTPGYLADQALALGGRLKAIKVEVLEEEQMRGLGMGALLSVARGSRQPAKLILMEYRGGKADQKPVALVGKGLTFDAGGISLKPGPGMDEMKYDMCGGASVIGAIQACAELELPINLVGLVPASENLPDGDANKPGDIVTSLSGKTIEVLNTDAEGRLILCDALTYAERFEPELVIDIATLTGACVVALGHHANGLLANHQKLADKLLAAGQAINDRAWQLPLWEEYQKQLDSPFADMANIGGKSAGTITAACFLSRFTEKFKWAHLDIAGTAWISGKDRAATGRPVPLLIQFLLDHCGQAE